MSSLDMPRKVDSIGFLKSKMKKGNNMDVAGNLKLNRFNKRIIKITNEQKFYPFIEE